MHTSPTGIRVAAPGTAEEHLREETRRFNVMLRERPADVPLWFRFVEFQDRGVVPYTHRPDTISRPY